MTVIVHGIPNCDTVRRARAWLDSRGIDHRFRDVRRDALDAGTVTGWAAAVGWEKLLNRAGTTFRRLPDADRVALDQDKAVALIFAHPATMKRPVVTGVGDILIGFDPEIWADRFDT